MRDAGSSEGYTAFRGAVLAMRRLAAIFFIWLSSLTTAGADEATYRQRLARYLLENSQEFRNELKGRPADIDVILTIDRNGKLLGADIARSSGVPQDDQNVLAGLRRMSAFPEVPADVQVPLRVRIPFTFFAQTRVGFVDLKWTMTSSTSGPEIAFRGDILHYLQAHPLKLPDDTQKLNDAHSIVEFSIDRDGTLLDARITKSSGPKAMNDDTLAWLRKLQPFPKPPSEVKVPMKLTADIVFSPKSIWNDEETRRKVSGICRGC